jgi:hypothetical protein
MASHGGSSAKSADIPSHQASKLSFARPTHGSDPSPAAGRSPAGTERESDPDGGARACGCVEAIFADHPPRVVHPRARLVDEPKGGGLGGG